MKNLMKVMMVVLAAVALTAFGRTARADQGEFDQPVPWVSAMSGPDGSLMIKQPDTDWFDAALNTPIGEGDMIWQGEGGRAEIYIDRGTYVRLDENSGLKFDALKDSGISAVMTKGTAEVMNSTGSDMYVDAPGQTVIVPRGAKARIRVDDNGATEIAAMRGKVFADGPDGVTKVHSGQTLETDPDGKVTNLSRGVKARGLDRWSKNRDAQIRNSAPPPTTAASYLPEPVVADMAADGVWLNDPEYGWVWQPRVAPGWAPYRIGKWVWRPLWGWTWVSYEPWGYYPYHYGRWVVTTAGWVWSPIYATAAWSPGLVFWFEGPDYYAWYPMPVGVTFAMVWNLGPDVIVQRYCRPSYITVINHNRFGYGHYDRYVRSWQGRCAGSCHVVRDFHGPRVHYGSNQAIYRTPTSRGYVPHNRAPRDQAVYAHYNGGHGRNNARPERVSYGAADRRAGHIAGTGGPADRTVTTAGRSRADRPDPIVHSRNQPDRTANSNNRNDRVNPNANARGNARTQPTDRGRPADNGNRARNEGIPPSAATRSSGRMEPNQGANTKAVAPNRSYQYRNNPDIRSTPGNGRNNQTMQPATRTAPQTPSNGRSNGQGYRPEPGTNTAPSPRANTGTRSVERSASARTYNTAPRVSQGSSGHSSSRSANVSRSAGSSRQSANRSSGGSSSSRGSSRSSKSRSNSHHR